MHETQRRVLELLGLPAGENNSKVTATASAGPGAHLSAMLKRFGIEHEPGCSCKSTAAKMDAMGASWCESDVGMAEILSAMRNEAGRRGMPFSATIAKILIRRAVAAARRGQMVK